MSPSQTSQLPGILFGVRTSFQFWGCRETVNAPDKQVAQRTLSFPSFRSSHVLQYTKKSDLVEGVEGMEVDGSSFEISLFCSGVGDVAPSLGVKVLVLDCSTAR